MIVYTLLLVKLVVVSFVLKDLAAFIAEIIITAVDVVDNKVSKTGLYLLGYLLSCNKCFSFWLSLVLSGDLFTAALAALIVEVTICLMNKYNIILNLTEL